MYYQQIYAINLSDYIAVIDELSILDMDYYISSIVVSRGTKGYHIKGCEDSKTDIGTGKLCILFNADYRVDLPALQISEYEYISPIWVDGSVFMQEVIGTDINSLQKKSFQQLLKCEVEKNFEVFKDSIDYAVENTADEEDYFCCIANLYADLEMAYNVASAKFRKQNSIRN